MKGWVFTFGVDGFGADVAPAHEEGVYLSFKKAFERLCELNSKLEHQSFFENGYGEGCYPDDDIELKQADEANDWELVTALLDKHRITDIKEICFRYCVNEEPPIGLYAIEEIKIFE
jgi:hypothetical protein